MTKSASEIAADMRAVAHDRVASQELLASLFAEQVELRHVPASPNDGPIAGALLATVARREVEAMPRAFDGEVGHDTDIAVEGETIRVRGRVTGTLRDGSTVELRTNTLHTIAGGQIVALESDMDPDSLATWQRVLAAGGMHVGAPATDT